MQKSCASCNKADEIQGYADRHDLERFFEFLKSIYGPLTSGSSPMLSVDGTKLITGKNEIVERRAEHFDGTLNRSSSINDAAIQRLPQVAINPELDIPPSEDEVAKAIKQMSCGKVPGPDAIPAKSVQLRWPRSCHKVNRTVQVFL